MADASERHFIQGQVERMQWKVGQLQQSVEYQRGLVRLREQELRDAESELARYRRALRIASQPLRLVRPCREPAESNDCILGSKP